MSKLTNNFMSTPEAAQRQARKAAVASYEESEEPEEVCVPEGPAYGSSTPYRPATARASARSMSSAVPTTPAAACVRQEYSYESHKPSSVSTAAAQLADLDIGQEADSCSSPVDSGLVGRRRPPSAAASGQRSSQTIAPAALATAELANHRSMHAAAVPLGAGFTSPLALQHASPKAAPKQEILQPRSRPGKGAGAKGQGWGEMVMEDMEELGGGDEEDAIPVPWGSVGTPRAHGRCTAGLHVTGAPLTVEQAHGLRDLLWGSAGSPPASWKQGFFFSTQPGLAYGLVQSEGGPCGVIASVQAYVLAQLMSTSGASNLSPSTLQQQAALVNGLADIIWQARRGPAAVLAVASGERAAAAASLGYDQLLRNVMLCEATSKEQLQALLQQSLNCYRDPCGWGVVLLLLSVLLSHGLQTVQGSMDDPNISLMAMHGYCTQELVNLLIAGEAVSNVFDGVKDLDGSCLRGITRRCRVGLLTLFEWYKYVEVGRSLKSPDLPIWVICSESHFTVLFSQDASALRNQLPCDFYYYDELARQQEPIRLTVHEDPDGGWTARVGNSIGDRGRYEGHNIPPLECVIETRWPGVHVNWNGSDPIL